MRVTFDVNLNISSNDQKEILNIVKSINLKLNNVPTKQQFEAALNEMSASIDNIAADIQRLTEQLQTGGLNEADENDILSQLQAKATQLKAIADTTSEPTTPEEPQP